ILKNRNLFFEKIRSVHNSSSDGVSLTFRVAAQYRYWTLGLRGLQETIVDYELRGEPTLTDARATDDGRYPLLSNFYFAGGAASFGTSEPASFWKRGSFRSGSNMGSSRSSAGVSGLFEARGPAYGIESTFCNDAMAPSGSASCAHTRARISSGPGPSTASFSIGMRIFA